MLLYACAIVTIVLIATECEHALSLSGLILQEGGRQMQLRGLRIPFIEAYCNYGNFHVKIIHVFNIHFN